MRALRALLPALSLLIATGSNAQQVLEERIRVRNVEPSVVLKRVDLLAGLPTSKAERLKLSADDASDTVIVQIPSDYGDPLEREQLRLSLREYIARLDQAEPKVEIYLYLVQSNLLSDQEFRVLDSELRKGPLRIAPGTSPKGVVFHDGMRADNLSIAMVDKTQAEERARTRPEPVRVTGRILPYVRPDGRIYLAAMMSAEAIDKPFADGKQRLDISDRAVPPADQPLIIVAGEKLPLGDAGRETFPGRHEIMMYVWAKPVR